MLPGFVTPPRNKIDWKKKRAILFHSDDWGLCAWSADLEASRRLERIYQRCYGLVGLKWCRTTLEDTGDMESLFRLLELFTDEGIGTLIR